MFEHAVQEVLRFYYDEKDVLKYELTAADKMAAKASRMASLFQSRALRALLHRRILWTCVV